MPVPKTNSPTTGRLRALALALFLGLVGLWLNRFRIPFLTEETPPFGLWQLPALLSFVLLGPVPGLVTAVLSVNWPRTGTLWMIHPGLALGPFVYVLEAAVAWRLYQRLRSLPLALVVFWLTLGATFDVLVYWQWVGINSGYVTILFVKQILNAILVGALVDLLCTRRIREAVASWVGHRLPTIDIERYAFRGVVVLAMLPVALVGILYAASQYREGIAREDQETSELGFSVGTTLLERLTEHQRSAQDLIRRLGSDWTTDEALTLLDEARDRLPGVVSIGALDQNGILLASSPINDSRGRRMIGRDLSDRPYLRRVQQDLTTTFSNLTPERFPIGSLENTASLLFAEPRLDRDGRFTGALIWSLDLDQLSQELIGDPQGRLITLLDAQNQVVVTNDPAFRPLESLDSPDRLHLGADVVRVAETASAGRLQEVLQARERQLFLRYLDTGGAETDLALDLSHSLFQPLSTPEGWGVLVDLPAERLYASFIPLALRISLFSVLLVIMVSAVIHRFARRLTEGVLSAVEVANSVQEGAVAVDSLESIRSSDLVEMRELAEAFIDLDQNLSEHRRAAEVREESLQNRLAEAEKMEAVGLLAGGVAHDFNNLLMPILGYAELGSSSTSEGASKEKFENIRAAANEAQGVTNQLLAFARRQVLEMETVDLVEELESLESLLRPLLRENISLRVEALVEQAPVRVDTAQFHRILFNLALNAQDAMPNGGELTVTVSVVTAGSVVEPNLDPQEAHRDLAVVSVTDTGCGIPQEIADQIFEPFFSTKRSTGTGLGLASVYGIVRQHDGFITFESEQGVGSTFRAHLPMAGRSSKASTGQSTSRADTDEPGARILVAEDEESVRNVVAAFLETSGHRVTTVESAEAAIEEMETAATPFDLLISDLVLPGMNGGDLVSHVRRTTPDLPVILISGYGHDVLVETGLPEGSRLLSKPFGRSQLLDAVRSVLEGRPDELQPEPASDAAPAPSSNDSSTRDS